MGAAVEKPVEIERFGRMRGLRRARQAIRRPRSLAPFPADRSRETADRLFTAPAAAPDVAETAGAARPKRKVAPR